MLFPFLTIFIAFLLFLAFRYRKISKTSEEQQAAFWKRELQANATPAQDITDLPYLTIPLTKFPLDFSEDSVVLDIERQLQELSEQKILNLNGVTNTELKVRYGVPNLNTMTEIGERYNQLTLLLMDYADALLEADRRIDAITVLEYGVVIKSDISRNYTLLADCYMQQEQPQRVQYLRDQVNAMDLPLKSAILRHLDGLLQK